MEKKGNYRNAGALIESCFDLFGCVLFEACFILKRKWMGSGSEERGVWNEIVYVEGWETMVGCIL